MRRKKKMMPRRRRRRGGKNRFLFWKNNLAKILEILGILAFFLFFLLWFPLEKCILVQSAPFRPHWWAENFLRGKKKDAGFEIFDIFHAKKRPFFPIFGPPLFLGQRPEKNISGFFDFFLQLNKKICTGPPSPPRTPVQIS